MKKNKNIENTDVETPCGVETPNERRKALALGSVALGATVAAPTAWFKPVVNAVILPAHAEISPPPPEEASFTVEKLQSGGPNPVTLTGDVLEYTITVTNTGETPLTGVVATDTLPDGTIVILSGAQESMTADGVLEVGESWVYETTYTVSADDILAGADLTNAVSVEVAELPDPQGDSVDTPLDPVPGECPLLEIGNVTASDVISGAEPCTISFEVLSADPGIDVTVISITNSTTTDTITYDAFGVASDTMGPRVIWSGSPQALDCAVPAEEITFTVTYTCDEDNVNGAEFTAEFLLSEIGALAI